MKIKQVINIVIILIMVGLLSSTIILYNKNVKQKDNIEYLRHNLSVKDTKISEMFFSEKELKQYISNKDTKHKVEIDSILKKHKIEIKNLISYKKIDTHQIIKDTILVDFKDTILKNDSLYHLPYNMVRDCNYISGEVISKDKNTKLFFTEIKNDNEIFLTKSYKKTFFDRIFFRRGKEVIKLSSKCGEVNYNEIIIK